MYTEDLLNTKLYIPPTRSEIVSRPRLIKLLNDGLHRKLTCISAPAGFGKTTLVSEWVEMLTSADQKDGRIVHGIGWLSLDENDDDRVRYLTYIVAALYQIESFESTTEQAAMNMLRSPQPPPTEVVLNSLINDIDAISEKFILVLDDYHLIQAQPVHDALAYLIKHLPPQMHLVISSREDPPLPLARLRSWDQLTDLRATDLRFTSSEAADFLNNVMALNLSPEEIRKLETRTEGWVTGLQLAALSMQGREDTTVFINSFTGSHHLVLDYLIEEVLERQSTSVQTFMLGTAILNRLTASLCNAVSDQEDSQEILQELERANLFIIPLDNERNWYRYHHLFQELLRQRLGRIDPAKGKELHRRAALWWDENGFFDQAIEHALLCGEPEWAASMLEDHIDELWHSGKGIVVWRWIRRLPIDTVNSKPMLCIMRGYFLHGAGEQEEAEQSLQLAEELIDSDQYLPANIEQASSASTMDATILKGKLAVIRGLMRSFWGEIPETIRYTDEALEYLPPNELGWIALAAIARCEIHAFLCDTAAARKIQSGAIDACKAASNDYFVTIASLRLAGTLKEQGHLQDALEICQQQLRISEERGLSESSTAGSLYLLLGEILAQTGEIDTALENAHKGITLDERSAYLPVRRCWSYLMFMRVLLSHSDYSGIETTIPKMRGLAPKSESLTWIASLAQAWQARVWIAQGRLDLAAEWLDEEALEVDCDPNDFDMFRLQEAIVVARVLIALGRLEEAEELLMKLHGFAQKNGLVAREIEILALASLANQAQGNPTEALAELESALTLAEPGGFIRVFVDEGPPMARLLYKALDREFEPKYVRRLLAAFPVAEPMDTDLMKFRGHPSELIEPLSERELEVLQRLAEGLTNREIADRLFLSLNTIKVHTRNIYGKLGVNNRTQAVARAGDLGLLDYQNT